MKEIKSLKWIPRLFMLIGLPVVISLGFANRYINSEHLMIIVAATCVYSAIVSFAIIKGIEDENDKETKKKWEDAEKDRENLRKWTELEKLQKP